MASRAAELSSSGSTWAANGRWVAALAAAVVPLVGVGCDSPQGRADRGVDEKIAMAVPKLSGTTADQTDAAKQLGDAATEAEGGSKWEQVQANVLKGDAELRLAQDLAAKVAFYNSQTQRLSLDLDQMAAEIAADNTDAASLQRLKPDAATASIRKQTAAVTGSDAKPDWVKTKAGTIASLAADDKTAADLSLEVDRLQGSIKSETDDRDKLLAQGDQLADQSGRERGDKSVDLYTQAADARKRAADVGVKLDADNMALARVQADLDGVRQQQEAKHGALKQFDAMQASVDADWKAVQGRMRSSKAAAAKLLGDPVAVTAAQLPKAITLDMPAADADAATLTTKLTTLSGGDTIRSKAATLAVTDKLGWEVRVQAENHYNAALGFYRKAEAAAESLRGDLDARTAVVSFQDKMDYPAVVGLADVMRPSRYRYLLAMAQLGKAEFFARQVVDANAQIEMAGRLKAALDTDGLDVPAGLDESAVTGLTTRQSQGVSTARASFKDAAENLGKLADTSTTPREIKDAVRTAQIVAEYGWAQLELSPGGTPADAAAHLELAKQKSQGGTDLAYVPLPPELTAPAATPMPTTPAGKPAVR